MKVDLNTNNQLNFQAKISPKFEKFMRDYINNGKNRIQNNYRLNQKLADFDKYGYDDYTVNLVSKPVAWGVDYVLVAAKDGQDIKDGIFLLKKNSVKQVINSFLDFNRSSFNNRMRKKSKYYA